MNSSPSLSRRDALRAGAALGAACCAADALGLGDSANEAAAADAPSAPPTTDAKRYRKAVKIGMVRVQGTLEDKFRLLKELGFDGVEMDSPGGPAPDVVAAAKERTGLEVHGVVDSAHWQKRLSDPADAVRAEGLAALREALRMAKAYGGTSVLLVPGRVTADATYAQCWERSIAEIKKALPLAEELGVRILIENVWNDFLTDPKEFARYIDECGSRLVGAYFDVGNAVKYSPPHEWIPILGERVGKLDIKDYGQARGFGHDLLDGDVDWSRVMDELRKIQYTGWGTAEIAGGDQARLTEIAKRMNAIFAK